jgi:hypothetical protein
MHENSFEGDEELGDDCAILKNTNYYKNMGYTISLYNIMEI